VATGDWLIHIRFRAFGDREIAYTDRQEDRNGQIVRYVGVPGLEYRIIIRAGGTDLRFRASRLRVMKMNVEKTGVRMAIVLLMLMEMLKRRLHK